MQEKIEIQGKLLSHADVAEIRRLLASNPGWSRYKLSRHLCEIWNWRNDKGEIKDIASRSLLRKLEEQGYIELPPRRKRCPQRMKDKSNRLSQLPELSKVSRMSEALPVEIELVRAGSYNWELFSMLLARYHYLGYKGSVGEQVGYLVWDRGGAPLGCMLFGAAAWRVEEELRRERSRVKEVEKAYEEERQKRAELEKKLAEIERQRDSYRDMIFKPKRVKGIEEELPESEDEATDKEWLGRMKRSKKRKRGGQRGHRGYGRYRPMRIDEERRVYLERCPICESHLQGSKTIKCHTVEDIPALEESRTKVVRYNTEVQWCPQCKKVVR